VGANRKTGKLLYKSSAAALVDRDMSTPVLDEFQRALVGFAPGDSSLGVLLSVHVLEAS
jgi:hypothetical protein